MNCVYITIYYVACVALSYNRLFMHVGVSETGKKVARSAKATKNVEVFIQNMFFSLTRLQFKKNYLFFQVSQAIFSKKM